MAGPEALEVVYFKEQLVLTHKMREVLRYSFERATSIMAEFQKEESSIAISLEQSEILEALTSRFARLADILIQKLFRAMDVLELSDEGSLIDRFNRMEKRGIVNNAQILIEMRKLRNRIAHDYALEDLMPLYQNIFPQCEVLFNIIDAIEHYAHEKGWISIES